MDIHTCKETELLTSDLHHALGCDASKIASKALELGLKQLQELAARKPDAAIELIQSRKPEWR